MRLQLSQLGSFAGAVAVEASSWHSHTSKNAEVINDGDGAESSNTHRYRPSPVIAISFAVFCYWVAIVHIYQYFKKRTWYFYAMLFATHFEVIGLIARALLSYHLDSLLIYLTSFLFSLLAPSLLAIACYMTLSRLERWITPTEKRTLWTLWLPPRCITPLFMVLDFTAILIQLLGMASIFVADETSLGQQAIENDTKVITVGVIMQMVCFTLFCIVCARFAVVSRKWSSNPNEEDGMRWRHLACTVQVVACLIMFRQFYRLIELVAAPDAINYLADHEWTFWVCDAGPILVSFILFSLVHPGLYLPAAVRCVSFDDTNLHAPKTVIEMHGNSSPTRNSSQDLPARERHVEIV